MQPPKIDATTGLFSRPYALTELERMCLYATRDESRFCVTLVDIDGFKSINDKYGFNVGDNYLRSLALAIQAVAGNNVVARYAGDEFIVLMRGATLEKALQLAEKIRLDASQVRVEHNGETVGPKSVTIGVACFPDDGNSALKLMGEAESALVIGKNHGKNCVLPARNSLRRDAPPY